MNYASDRLLLLREDLILFSGVNAKSAMNSESFYSRNLEVSWLNRKYNGFQIFHWLLNSVETNSIETSPMSPNVECVDITLKWWTSLSCSTEFVILLFKTDQTYLFLSEYDSKILRISSKSAATYVTRAWYRPDICSFWLKKTEFFRNISPVDASAYVWTPIDTSKTPEYWFL